MTCALCIALARDTSNPTVYGRCPAASSGRTASSAVRTLTSATCAAVTLFSFAVALVFFLSEHYIFHTVSLRGFISPGIVASAWL
jgi:hypothetical protein